MSKVLVLNCGSSSVKFAVIDPSSQEMILSGLVENIAKENCKLSQKYKNLKTVVDLESASYADVFKNIKVQLEELNILDDISAIGHRVVHGGSYFKKSVSVDEQTIENIKKCIVLAPLHNPANVQGVEFCLESFSNIPQAVVFDTSFHQSIAKHVYKYAIPDNLATDNGIRKYGFHGTSYRYVAEKSSELLGIKNGNFIIAHLGNGCSISAIADGKSVDTSMGFTPLDGLIMGTRSGNIDAGVINFLSQNLGYDIDKISNMLNKQSGLLGICGLNDMREILDKIESGNSQAELALDMFTHRIAQFISSYMMYFENLDALVFTGGIGENSDKVRAKIISKVKNLGFEVSAKLNSDREANFINSKDSKYEIMVVATNEELMIAKDAINLVNKS